MEAALDEDGVVIGLRADLVMDHGAYPFLNLPLSLFANIIKVLLPGTLRVRHYQFQGIGGGHQQGVIRGLPGAVGDRVLGAGAPHGPHRPPAQPRPAGSTPPQLHGR